MVDDGLATGGSAQTGAPGPAAAGGIAAGPGGAGMRAGQRPATARGADAVVCLLAPPDFAAVGVYYVDFAQTSDEEVLDLVRRPRDPQEVQQ